MGNLLTTLGIDQSTQNMLPKDVLEAETFVTAMQVVYESTPEGSRKELLASTIAENVRLILKEINRLIGGVEEKKEFVEEKETEEPKEKPSEPKLKEDELPFKVGEKYILRGKGKPYTIEEIDLPKQEVMISGFDIAGNPKQSYFDIKWIAEKIENGELTLYIEKQKKERKPRATKPKVEKSKKEPKQESPQTEPPKVKEISKENQEKIKMLLDEKEEILDALIAFDVTDPEYDELNNEIKRINQEINKLNN